MNSVIATASEAILLARAGKILILVDDKNRENEGDFFVAASLTTPQKLNFMITYGKGLVCAAITPEIAKRLALPLMVPEKENEEFTKCNFTISVDARNGIGSGISAPDRAKTIKVLAEPTSKPSDLLRPGHIFPLVAHKNGLFAREGHTEAAVELARLAALEPVGVICEIIRPDGKMATLKDLIALAKKHELKILFISDLVEYLKNQKNNIDQKAQANLQTKYGEFSVKIFQSRATSCEHPVLSFGAPQEPVLLRLHSQCITGEVFGALTCDCRDQLDEAMRKIAERGSGLIIYLNQEGRGIGLSNKIRAYKLKENGLDTIEANTVLGLGPDMRDYQDAASILHHLGVNSVELLTNNPAKVASLEKYGIKVKKRIPLEIPPRKENRLYLAAKKKKLGHKLTLV